MTILGTAGCLRAPLSSTQWTAGGLASVTSLAGELLPQRQHVSQNDLEKLILSSGL